MQADPTRARIERRRDQALADIRDLDRQVEAGEILPERAALLRDRYAAEAAAAMAELEDLPPTAEPRSRKRVLVGTGLFLGLATLVTASLVVAVDDRPPGDLVTGGAGPEAPVDLDAVTNEQLEAVVAANPDVKPMRLALARRYLEQGDFSTALDHYMYVLERETDPEALMYVGWMTYLSGDPATGVALLEESLRIRPGEVQAQWFLANAFHTGLGDPEAARPLLQAVIDSGQAPADVVEAATEMLAG